MKNLIQETVTHVHHWNESLFSFKTTRDKGLRFENGHFTMIGLEIEGKPLMRAYSIASANYENEMEFFSIKVKDGPLTQHLQNLKVGDNILVNTKTVGTLVADNLLPGKHLYLLGTGTGLAPFMSIIKDPAVYEKYDKIILAHGVRNVSELAYQNLIEHELPQNEYFGEQIKQKLLYYPTVTREGFYNQGRLTELIKYGKLFKDLHMPLPEVEKDRFMLCGSPGMLKDMGCILNEKGFRETVNNEAGHYLVERAFVE